MLQVVKYKTALLNCPGWVPVNGYGGLYQVHWRGAVRNAGTKMLLRPGLAGNGYYTVSLTKDKLHKSFTVHSLVAKHFIQNPENKRCVNHKDGIKTNNHVSNLEWATHYENNIHAVKTGLRPIRMTQAIIDYVLSVHISQDKIYGTKALAKKLGFDKSYLTEVIQKYKYGNNQKSLASKSKD